MPTMVRAAAIIITRSFPRLDNLEDAVPPAQVAEERNIAQAWKCVFSCEPNVGIQLTWVYEPTTNEGPTTAER